MFIIVARATGITKHITYMKNSIYNQSITTPNELLSSQYINSSFKKVCVFEAFSKEDFLYGKIYHLILNRNVVLFSIETFYSTSNC